MRTGEEKKEARSSGDEKSEVVLSELHEPVWSVVDFERRLHGGLTYEEAAEALEKYRAEKVSGLCIITDEAAERIGRDREK